MIVKQTIKRIVRSRQFLMALLRAARRKCRVPQACLVSARNVLRALLRPKHARRVTQRAYYRRLKHCYRCPVFVRGALTCGPVSVNGQDLGCFCYMPVKARDPQARCWLHEQGVMDRGWPKDV